MAPRPPQLLRTCRLGRVEYEATAALQRSLRASREAGAIDDTLLLLEHDEVITCGTRTEESEIAYARTKGVKLVPVERGGKATWHGPGQVVAYPIVDLSIVDDDVKELVYRLEQAIINTLAAHGLDTDRRAGYPGVWVDACHEFPPRKIASVGLRLTRGVTFHGIAINVACDLEPFTWFTPCGIPEAQMTSLVQELAVEALPGPSHDLLVRSIESYLEQEIARQFGRVTRPIGVDDLRLVAMRFPTEPPNVALPGELRPSRLRDVTAGEREEARA
jgi:lipoyl(octanoyl) transferase